MRPFFMTKRPLRLETTLGPVLLGAAAPAAAQRVDALLHVEAGEARLLDRECAIELQPLGDVAHRRPGAGRSSAASSAPVSGICLDLIASRRMSSMRASSIVTCSVDLAALDVLAAHHFAARDDVRVRQQRRLHRLEPGVAVGGVDDRGEPGRRWTGWPATSTRKSGVSVVPSTRMRSSTPWKRPFDDSDAADALDRVEVRRRRRCSRRRAASCAGRRCSTVRTCPWCGSRRPASGW